MSSASLAVDYTCDGDCDPSSLKGCGGHVLKAAYHGGGDVLAIDDGAGQSMAIGYDAARALLDALAVLSQARAELGDRDTDRVRKSEPYAC